MTLELGFYLCLAVAGWLTLGPLTERGESPRGRSFCLFGLLIGLWSLGELLIMGAETPTDRALARRLFFLGSAGLPPAWFCLAVHTARPGWFNRMPWLVLLPFLAPAFFYSSLYWDADSRFISLTSPEPVHGPWFDLYVHHQYAVSIVATGLFAFTAIRMGRSNLRILAALAVGVLLPIGLNLLYMFGIVETDWTAVALAPASLLLWMAVTESDLASRLPLDRHDLIDQLDVGVVVAEPEGLVVSANPAAAKLCGVAPLVGWRLADLEAAIDQRDDAVIESRSVTVEGRFGAVGHALILTDRTEAEANRRRLALGGRLEALGSLTAGIAHEVNNPLTYIQANLCVVESTAKLLQEDGAGGGLSEEIRIAVEDLGCLIEETQEGVERIRALVQRLGSFSRTPDLEATAIEVDIATIARQAASLASLGHSADCIRIEGESPLRIPTIETAVFQILVNLFLNAVQAGGEEPRVDVALERDRSDVVIHVADQGPGLAEDVLPRVFDPFFTTRGDGMGLGLSLSYDLATGLGGQLAAANRESGGAVFTLRLSPVRGEPLETSPA